MNIQAKKIHLIEEFLKVKNDTILHELESVLKKAKNKTKSNHTIYDFVGIWNKKEADQIKKVIAATSEQINADDWK
jgi:hypothetical protein